MVIEMKMELGFHKGMGADRGENGWGRCIRLIVRY